MPRAKAETAMASIPDSGATFHGCRGSGTGVVRLIDPSAGQSCRSNEAAFTFTNLGPTGPTGATGVSGQSGPPGPSGVRVVTGTDTVQCAENEALVSFVCASGAIDGTKCATPGTAATGLCAPK